MLIGAHVSTAGGLVAAHERGRERRCDAIQVFNQSPRMWRPTRWKDHDIAEFRGLMKDGPIKSVVIHAVYLINCASEDRDLRAKSLASLVHALRMGDEIGADGVVVHPGSALKSDKAKAIKRAGGVIGEALAESDGCDLLLEDTAGAGSTLGRSFGELADLIELAGASKRLGLCLDSCHLFASGFDVRTADGLKDVLDEGLKAVGKRRLRCLHVNDSKTKLGSNSDRHAPLGTGELGARGCAAFLSEPRFEKLPIFFEGPGFAGGAPTLEDVQRMRELRRNGLRSRKRRAGG
jgi:deoxyribonuclease IV